MHVRQSPVNAICAHLQADHFQFTPQVPAPMPAAKRRKGPNGRKSSYYDDDDDDDDMPRKGRRSQSKVGPTPATPDKCLHSQALTLNLLTLVSCHLVLGAE